MQEMDKWEQKGYSQFEDESKNENKNFDDSLENQSQTHARVTLENGRVLEIDTEGYAHEVIRQYLVDGENDTSGFVTLPSGEKLKLSTISSFQPAKEKEMSYSDYEKAFNEQVKKEQQERAELERQTKEAFGEDYNKDSKMGRGEHDYGQEE